MAFWFALVVPIASFLGWIGIDIALTDEISNNVILVYGMDATTFFEIFWLDLVIIFIVLYLGVCISTPVKKINKIRR